MLFCSWESSGGSKGNKWLPTVSAPHGVALCKRQQPAQLLTGSVAELCGCGGLRVQIQLNLCPCRIRQAAICKMLNLSYLRNTYNHNLFLWKTCHFNICSSTTQLSPELGTYCLWIINNPFRTGCGLSSRKLMLVNASKRMGVLPLLCIPFPPCPVLHVSWGWGVRCWSMVTNEEWGGHSRSDVHSSP